ncbi:MAG: hypothetical protein HZA54_19220 [Planctomycetes bacterium]|nr:hypothetical protein [Planctomycetota bacterium]
MSACPRLVARGYVDLVRQGRLLGRPRVATPFLVAGCILIFLWQCLFVASGRELERTWRAWGCTGARLSGQFLYFYWYLGVYPVTTGVIKLDQSGEGARRFVAEHGDSLRTEQGYAIRDGSLGKLFLYLPDTWLSGTPDNASMWPTSALAFMLALEALFVAFCWARRPFLGLLLVLLAGSHPFQLYEVYGNDNVFGWTISIALLVLAFHLPILVAKRAPQGAARLYPWAVALGTGLLLSCVMQVRIEPASILLSAAAAYLTSAYRPLLRLGLVAVLLAALAAGLAGWRTYFAAKIDAASRFVEAAGGIAYRGGGRQLHQFWHPVWCGLGDFDDRHGYAFDDVKAHAYAREAIQERYGERLPALEAGGFYTQEYWDAGRNYVKMPWEWPRYGTVLRDKVLHDVASDPLWYLGIVARRVLRVLTETPPARLALGTASVPVPSHGLAFVALVVLLLALRRWTLLKLALFLVPTSLPAVAIYSGGGISFASCYHLLAPACAGAWLLEGALGAYAARARRRLPPAASAAGSAGAPA